ncbi:MAG: AbrB/MazE/SpoVT family DNA-binding domain-containing protein [Synergistaceae bacterium]|jgi:AbrB family looped-hinge helix DNA binding protein|nr:AbrB/MazE/SpoVT family DNA-binding domain-containing protein [Synergistaceae bacterium]
MDVAKITSKGQITIPADIRRKLSLKEGDKIIFIEQDGRCYFENAALVAIERMQKAFAGEAERVGLKNEDDVVRMVREIRRERWEKRAEPQNASNA